MRDIPNRRIVLARRPTRRRRSFDASDSKADPLAPPREGELSLRTLWLSLDPYMRGRMSDAPSYAPPVAVGDIMIGQTVSVVEASRHPAWHPGDRVLANSGWQEHEVTDGRTLVRLPADMAHPSYALGVLGMPGFTAFVGLLDIGKPRADETLVVAAATGAVGSVVGQIAKLKGCRVVGIAGGPDKCAGPCASSASTSASTIGRIRLRVAIGCRLSARHRHLLRERRRQSISSRATAAECARAHSGVRAHLAVQRKCRAP